MLLLAIASANLKPSADTWTKVADLLGEGLTASAVRSGHPDSTARPSIYSNATARVRDNADFMP